VGEREGLVVKSNSKSYVQTPTLPDTTLSIVRYRMVGIYYRVKLGLPISFTDFIHEQRRRDEIEWGGGKAHQEDAIS
jgi:hypothetical protein